MKMKHIPLPHIDLIYDVIRSEQRDSTQLKAKELIQLVRGKIVLRSKFEATEQTNSPDCSVQCMAILHEVSMN